MADVYRSCSRYRCRGLCFGGGLRKRCDCERRELRAGAELRVTRDGGEHWTALPALPMRLGFVARSSDAVTGVYFANAKNGYLFGPGLELSHDGGQTWSRARLPTVVQLAGGAGYVYAASDSPAHGFRLWRNAVGSNIWVAVSLPARQVSSEPGRDGFQLGDRRSRSGLRTVAHFG